MNSRVLSRPLIHQTRYGCFLQRQSIQEVSDIFANRLSPLVATSPATMHPTNPATRPASRTRRSQKSSSNGVSGETLPSRTVPRSLSNEKARLSKQRNRTSTTSMRTTTRRKRRLSRRPVVMRKLSWRAARTHPLVEQAGSELQNWLM